MSLVFPHWPSAAFLHLRLLSRDPQAEASSWVGVKSGPPGNFSNSLHNRPAHEEKGTARPTGRPSRLWGLVPAIGL